MLHFPRGIKHLDFHRIGYKNGILILHVASKLSTNCPKGLDIGASIVLLADDIAVTVTRQERLVKILFLERNARSCCLREKRLPRVNAASAVTAKHKQGGKCRVM